MPSPASSRITAVEYLALERQADHKSEYLNGEVFAMIGASRRHNLISLNIGAELRAQVKQRPCEVYVSDMRVKTNATGLYTYPDVVVVCGTPIFEDAAVDTLLNPTVLIEILSKTTQDYDQGGKFEHYRTLDTLQDYLLVAQHHCHLMHYHRQPHNAWLLTETRDIAGVVPLPSINCTLALTEVYAKVELDNP